MNFDEVLKARRSYREYTDQPVDRALVEQIIEAARIAPGSCNLQVTKYIVIDDKDLLQKLAKEISYKFAYSPCMIVVLYDKRFTIGRYSVVTGTGMAAENMVLKAADLGLGTCPMAGFGKDQRIKDILKIPDYFDLALLISVGHIEADSEPRAIPRIDIKDVYNYNSYGEMKNILASDNLDDHSPASIADYRSRIAPVYVERFRLNTYKNKYYEDLADFVKGKVLPDIKVDNIFDVMSYDGQFLKNIYERGVMVSTSDYVKDNLDYFSEKFNCQSHKIDENNNIWDLDDSSVDMMSFVFQINFTPQVENLIKSMHKKLKSDAYVLVATVEESRIKTFIKSLQKFYKKNILKKLYNIYENNQYYRVGPIKYLGDSKINSLFTEAGFSLYKKGLVAKYQGGGVKLNYYIFKK